MRTQPQLHGLERSVDRRLLAAAEPALDRGERVRIRRRICNTDRSVGAMLAGEVARRHPRACPPTAIVLDLHGIGGQSLGAWLPPGVTLRLTGAANDTTGKGLSGGRLVLRALAAGRAWADRRQHRALRRHRAARHSWRARRASGSRCATRARARWSRAWATTAAST